MQIETTRFGTVEIAAEDVLEFERGPFGFETVHRWVLLRHAPGSPLRLLQAVELPHLAFAVIEPFLICPEYTVELSKQEAAAVGFWNDSSLLVFVVVGVGADPDEMTANMKGPILIDPDARRGMQIVLPGDRWPARLRVMEALRGRNDPPRDGSAAADAVGADA